MDFFQLVSNRESVRGYIERPVEREKIIKIIEAASLAPSACNAQPWKFVVVDDKEKLSAIAKSLCEAIVGLNKFAITAPAFVVVVGDKRNFASKIGEIIKHKDYTSMDIGIASEHICLAATELGLGTCMMGWFKEKEIKKLLNIPMNREIHLVISLGYYENKEPRVKGRKPLDSMLSFNEYK